jgi:hypothetical protein
MILPGTHSNMLNPLANPPALATPPLDLILPDDSPNSSQLKMTPIGQIVKSSGAGGGTKKKSKVVADGSKGGNVGAGAAAAAGFSALLVAVGMSGTCLADSEAQKKGAISVVDALSWCFAILVNKFHKIIRIFKQLDHLRNWWVLCQH